MDNYLCDRQLKMKTRRISRKSVLGEENSPIQQILEKGTVDRAEHILNLLKETITSFEGKSVYELSTEHKVVGIFIKWFGCKFRFFSSS